MLTPRISAVTGNLTSNAQVTIEPFERGLGKTVGFALRRILLSSIAGVAITQISVGGTSNQLSAIYGLVEDTSQLITNIRQVVFQTEENSLTARLTKDSPGTIYASDIRTTKSCRIINPCLVIGHLNTGRINFLMKVQKGRGYATKGSNSQSDSIITLDATFSPVKSITYSVGEVERKGNVNAEKLVLGIQTNSSVSPIEALKQSVKILKVQLSFMGPTPEEKESRNS